ncbi:MAG: type III secretion protein HrpB4 [Janthinobacterium lividum]
MTDIDAHGMVARRAEDSHGAGMPCSVAECAPACAAAHHVTEGGGEVDTPERLHDLVAALRRYDARMKGLAGPAAARAPMALASRAPHLSGWHWYREMLLPASLGNLPAPLFDDPAVRLALAEPPLMMAGLVARALYARRSALRRCIDRTVLTELRSALGEGAVGRERLHRLQHLATADGNLPLPEVLTPTGLAHDGLARLRRERPEIPPVVVHFVLMQLDGPPRRVAEDVCHAPAIGRAAATGGEAAAFFKSLPYLIPELS